MPMKTYQELVDEVATLHEKWAPTAGFQPSHLVVPGNWIPTVADTTTAKVTDTRRIIVAIGANFATSTGKLPSSSSRVHRRQPPWIEDNLIRCRGRALLFLHACSSGATKAHWNGLLPFDPELYDAKQLRIDTEEAPHFLMTNISPWITTVDWSKIRDASLEDLFGILASPSNQGGGQWSYFRHLKKCVGRDAIWIGHGNADIYGIFRLLCWKLKIRNWFFDSNLSHKSQMISGKVAIGPTSKGSIAPNGDSALPKRSSAKPN